MGSVCIKMIHSAVCCVPFLSRAKLCAVELYSTEQYGAVLCCAVLCCAVLCCAVLCCAVLCCAVPCRAMPCCALLSCAVLCYCCVLLAKAATEDASHDHCRQAYSVCFSKTLFLCRPSKLCHAHRRRLLSIWAMACGHSSALPM